MLEKGTLETIGDIRKRYVFVPKDPQPNKLMNDAYLAGYNQGRIDEYKYLKAVGKL